jgi:ATP-dependent RNA helicase DDX5/DBP2
MQIEEIRSQLKINVSVASGSPPAPAPIESFEDMVNSLLKKKEI